MSEYSLHSIISRCMDMNVWYKRIQCPNRHCDNTKLKKVGRMTHWQCNVCGRKFWTEEYKPPTSVPR